MTTVLPTALTLPGVEVGIWQIRNQCDGAALQLADRHYSREKVGSPQVGGPGRRIVMVSPCERAVWISKRHASTTKSPRALADGFLNAYRCAMFRNEGAGLSSDLIREAVAITEERWGPPEQGWVTYVAADKVTSANPGYCFKQAGWTLDRTCTHPSLIRLIL